MVLFIADSPKTKSFRVQLEKSYDKYSQFASEKAIFVAAFRQGDGPVNSDVPFSVALNGPAVAEAYGLANHGPQKPAPEPTPKPAPTRLFGKVPIPSLPSMPAMPKMPGSDSPANDFNAVVIGRDGNVDSQTSLVMSAQRIIDILQNSFERQSETRKSFIH